MESHPHTLMDGTDRAAGSARGRLALLTDRLLGRRRTYLVDPSYQVRSAIIAVLGMAFLLVFAGALFHLLSVENARILAQSGPTLVAAKASGEMRSVAFSGPSAIQVGTTTPQDVTSREVFHQVRVMVRWGPKTSR